MRVRVLCVAHLHAFEVPAGADETVCPECGCRHVRLAPEPASEGVAVARRARRTTVRVERGRHPVGGGTWLDDRKAFVTMAQKLAPELSEAELKESLERWHP